MLRGRPDVDGPSALVGIDCEVGVGKARLRSPLARCKVLSAKRCIVVRKGPGAKSCRVSMKGMVRRRVCAYTAKFFEGGLKVAGVYLVAKARNVEVVTGVSAPVATTANRTM